MAAVSDVRPVSPERQCMAALRYANEVRFHQRDRKRQLKFGSVTLEVVFGDPLCASMYVQQALLAVPGIGCEKADRIMVKAGVSPSKRCGGLTERQRSALVAHAGYYPAARGALS